MMYRCKMCIIGQQKYGIMQKKVLYMCRTIGMTGLGGIFDDVAVIGRRRLSAAMPAPLF